MNLHHHHSSRDSAAGATPADRTSFADKPGHQLRAEHAMRRKALLESEARRQMRDFLTDEPVHARA